MNTAKINLETAFGKLLETWKDKPTKAMQQVYNHFADQLKISKPDRENFAREISLANHDTLYRIIDPGPTRFAAETSIIQDYDGSYKLTPQTLNKIVSVNRKYEDNLVPRLTRALYNTIFQDGSNERYESTQVPGGNKCTAIKKTYRETKQALDAMTNTQEKDDYIRKFVKQKLNLCIVTATNNGLNQASLKALNYLIKYVKEGGLN